MWITAPDNTWDVGYAGTRKARYAIRAGSELARLNGLEPSPEWRELGEDDHAEVITKDHEVGYCNGLDPGWVYATGSVGKTYGAKLAEDRAFRARRRVGTESKVKRFSPGMPFGRMIPDGSGDYVLYSDIAHLIQTGEEGV